MEVVQTAMTTGEVEVKSDAAIIKSETDNLEQGMTDIITEMQDLEIVTGTQGEIEWGKDELHEIKEEHTHVELVRDIEVERVECLETQCEGQINLPQERGETVCSLEAGCDEVSPVRLYGVERVYGANERTLSFGRAETPGSLVLTQTPDVNVPECVGMRE